MATATFSPRVSPPQPSSRVSTPISSPSSSKSLNSLPCSTISPPPTLSSSPSSSISSDSFSQGTLETEPKVGIFPSILPCLQCEIAGLRCSFGNRSAHQTASNERYRRKENLSYNGFETQGKCCDRCMRNSDSLCMIQGIKICRGRGLVRIGEFKAADSRVDMEKMRRRGLELIEDRKERISRKSWALPLWDADQNVRMKTVRAWRRRFWGNEVQGREKNGDSSDDGGNESGTIERNYKEPELLQREMTAEVAVQAQKETAAEMMAEKHNDNVVNRENEMANERKAPPPSEEKYRGPSSACPDYHRQAIFNQEEDQEHLS